MPCTKACSFARQQVSFEEDIPTLDHEPNLEDILNEVRTHSHCMLSALHCYRLCAVNFACIEGFCDSMLYAEGVGSVLFIPFHTLHGFFSRIHCSNVTIDTK